MNELAGRDADDLIGGVLYLLWALLRTAFTFATLRIFLALLLIAPGIRIQPGFAALLFLAIGINLVKEAAALVSRLARGKEA